MTELEYSWAFKERKSLVKYIAGVEMSSFYEESATDIEKTQ